MYHANLCFEPPNIVPLINKARENASAEERHEISHFSRKGKKYFNRNFLNHKKKSKDGHLKNSPPKSQAFYWLPMTIMY